MKKDVTVVLKRLPTHEDFLRVGLVSSSDLDAGFPLIDDLMHNYDGKTVCRYDDESVDCDISHGPVVWADNFYLPADLFTITFI